MISRITFWSAQPEVIFLARFADAVDLAQPFGGLLDDVEHRRAEGRRPAGRRRPGRCP